jgi:cob(I)alamin adenosyltransferase
MVVASVPMGVAGAEREMAEAERKGLVIVLTGDGKGKTTAALGMALRAVGHDWRVAMVQFVKRRECGEDRAAQRLAPDLEIHRMGLGFVPPPGEGPREEHERAAREAMEFVRGLLEAGRHEMVIADEILTAVGLGLLAAEAVLALASARPEQVCLVLTGRGAPAELIERADLVTEMRAVKHPHEAGIEAQPGVEY